jgi:hypothetical protein
VSASAPAPERTPVPLDKPIECKLAGEAGASPELDNESICRALAPKANAGTATPIELRQLRAACSALGDKGCRDGATAAMRRMDAGVQ